MEDDYDNKTLNINTGGSKDEEEIQKLDLENKTLGRAFKNFK